jgi:hypothetical protein
MDLRDEFHAGWQESAERGSARDELRQLGAWLLGRPRALLRFLAHYGRALLRAVLGVLRDALRGTPVLLGLIVRGILRAVRAGFHASAGAGEKPPVPAGAGGSAIEEVVEEEAALASDAPAGPPWKRRQKPAQAPAQKVPAAAPASGGLSAMDVLERAAIAFLVLALGATFLGMAGSSLAGLLAPYADGIIFGLFAVWVLVAAMVAPRGEESREDDDEGGNVEADQSDEDPTGNDHEVLGEQPEESDPWPAQREAIRKRVAEVAAAGAAGHRDAKGKGVPVDDLIAEFWPAGAPKGVDRNAVLALLERADITVRPQMKFRIGGRQKTPPGVHVDDLQNDLGYRPTIPAPFVPDLTPQPGPSRELRSTP